MVKSMPRPRSKDPLGVSDHPIAISDPAREAELVAEFEQKLEHIKWSYIRSKGPFADFLKKYNDDLARLQKQLKTGDPGTPRGIRIHPLLEKAINDRALEFARQRTGDAQPELECEDVELAAHDVAGSAKAIRGRPKELHLVRHVRGLMALFQQYFGRPVVGSKTHNSVYGPRVSGAAAHILEMLNAWGARLTPTRLYNIIDSARTEYAGKRMDFEEFFPLYGVGEPPLRSGQRLADGATVESFTISRPIYFAAATRDQRMDAWREA